VAQAPVAFHMADLCQTCMVRQNFLTDGPLHTIHLGRSGDTIVKYAGAIQPKFKYMDNIVYLYTFTSKSTLGLKSTFDAPICFTYM